MMRLLAVDTETRGLDWFDPDQNRAFMATWSEDEGDYFATEDDPASIKDFRAALDAADTLVFHNAKFDLHQIRETWGWDLVEEGYTIHDTDPLSRVLFPRGAGEEAAASHKLKALAKFHLGIDNDSEKQIEELAKSIGLRTLKAPQAYYKVWRAYPEAMEEYALNDTRITYDLFIYLMSKLDGRNIDVYELERKVLPILYRAEKRGMALDRPRVTKLLKQYTAEQKRLHEQLVAVLGVEALDGDKAMLSAILALGVPLYRKSKKTGVLETGKFAIQEFENEFPILKTLARYRTVNLFIRTFLGPMEKRAVIHPSIHQLGAWTSRMCISEGTLIDGPRDLLKHPLGVPIEKIQVGDVVYSLDDQGQPRPQQVLRIFKQGKKAVVKIVWQSDGTKTELGVLKVTPCHRVRLRDGSYKRADQLKQGDQLAFLSRSVNGDLRARLFWAGGAAMEHSYICPVSDSDNEVTHHIDENRLNNHPDNLSVVTRVHAMHEYHHDHRTLPRWADELGVPLPDKRIKNHKVIAVIDEGEEVETYDLEVENTHNYVANEIFVHNSCSRPNMQNIPRGADGVRSAIVPRKGYAFVVADYSSIEVRLLAYYLGDPTYRQRVKDEDPHAWMASKIHSGTVEDYLKDTPGEEKRDKAKNTLFAISYGAGGPRISDMNQISIPEARALIKKVKGSLPGFYRLNRLLKEKIEKVGCVNTMIGRKQPVSKDKSYVGLNALIQGSAADIMKQGMVNADAAYAAAGIDATILMIVHDELIVEVTEHEAALCLKLTEDAMRAAADFDPGLEVKGKYTTKSYGDAK